MRTSRPLIVSIIILVLGVFAHAAETPIPPPPTRWVTDTAGFMSPEGVRALDAQLSAYERSTGHQVIVYIASTTGDAPIDDWAVRAFEQWKLGRKGLDDGLALFIMAQDQKLRIEVGYGLEGNVPDVVASRIIREVIVPRIQRGDRDGAVNAGVQALTKAIGGDSGGGAPPERVRGEAKPPSLGQMILFGIIALVVLFLFITNPSLAFFFLASILSGGGRGGGGFGGGGGFRGGGGRSGGGGASGSW